MKSTNTIYCLFVTGVLTTTILAGGIFATGCNKDNKSDTLANDNAHSGYMPETKGMELTYTITQGDETGSSSILKIENIRDSAGYKIAEGIATAAGISAPFYMAHNEDKTIQPVFPVPAYYESIALIEKQFTTFTHSETPYIITIPHNDQLHTIVFPETVFAKWHAEESDEYISLVQDHTQTETRAEIDSIAKITISTGSFDAVRIHHLRKTNTHIVSNDYDGSQTIMDDGTEFDEKEWYARGLGVIKTEETNLKTGILTVTELTKIKKP